MITKEAQFDGSSQPVQERVLALCSGPYAFIRNEMAAAELRGCGEWHLLQTERDRPYNATCTGKKFTFGIDSANSAEFRITEDLSAGMKVTTARWLTDCAEQPAR